MKIFVFIENISIYYNPTRFCQNKCESLKLILTEKKIFRISLNIYLLMLSHCSLENTLSNTISTKKILQLPLLRQTYMRTNNLLRDQVQMINIQNLFHPRYCHTRFNNMLYIFSRSISNNQCLLQN